jgi:hypothetical protein
LADTTFNIRLVCDELPTPLDLNLISITIKEAHYDLGCLAIQWIYSKLGLLGDNKIIDAIESFIEFLGFIADDD